MGNFKYLKLSRGKLLHLLVVACLLGLGLATLSASANLTSSSQSGESDPVDGRTFSSSSLEQRQSDSASSAVSSLSLESVFGKFAKTAVYGGATFARLNNRVLCPLFASEQQAGSTNKSQAEQPVLYVFNDPSNPARAYRFYSDDTITADMLEDAQFDPNQMTLLYLHGWLGGIHKELWLSEAKNAALTVKQQNGHRHHRRRRSTLRSPAYNVRRGQVQRRQHQNQHHQEEAAEFRPNVIIVDWSDMAMGSLYSATQNSFIISKRLGSLLAQMARVGGLRPELMHCFGHSIGAHICGQAARLAFGSTATPERDLAPKFGRISALDPGGFCYELGIKNESTYLGLKPSDALIVDAYYSNRAPFGNRHQVAQYNIRLTNGFFQQACSVWKNAEVARDYFRATAGFLFGYEGQNEVITCDHYFATRFAKQQLYGANNSDQQATTTTTTTMTVAGRELESAQQAASRPAPCSYVGYKCNSYRTFKRGKCGLCESPSQCYSMTFEYQREAPSVRHALRHLDQYSNYSRETTLGEPGATPIGGVPFAKRSVYYMRVAEREPFCGRTYRIRVQLDKQRLSGRQLRAANAAKLHLIDKLGDQIRVIDANSEERSGSVSLHGPWLTPSGSSSAEDAEIALEKFGVDEATLTALIELSHAEKVRDNLISETHALLFIDPDRKLPEDAIKWVQIDYLSAANKRVRAEHSRLFHRDKITVITTKTR